MPFLTCTRCGHAVPDVAPVCQWCGTPLAASAVTATPASPSPPQARDNHLKPALAILAAVGVTAAAVATALLVPLGGPVQGAPPSPAAAPVVPPVAIPAPVNPAKVALERMDSLPAYPAFAVAKPFMTDEANADSDGSLLLAAWAYRHMKWSDVFVAADETTFAKVRKDPDSQRGARMCSTGTLIEIRDEKDAVPMSRGIFESDSDHLYRFLATGSSGDLTESSRATLCGFVTGVFDYGNSAGGVGHAVTIVGMFDLPQNRRR